MDRDAPVTCAVCGERFERFDQYEEHHRAHVSAYLDSRGCSAQQAAEEAASEATNPTSEPSVSRLSDGRYAMTGAIAAERVVAPEEDWVELPR